VKNTNIILLSFLVAVMTISLIQYSDAASANDRNVTNFCNKIAPYYKVDKSGTIEKYENNPFLKLCSFHSGSQTSSASSNHYTKSTSSSNDYTNNVATNYWAEKSKSKTTSNDYTNNVATNYWAEKSKSKTTSNDFTYFPAPTVELAPLPPFKFDRSMHSFDTPNQIEVKKFIPVQIPDKIQTFEPRNNDYQPFNNDYKPNAPGNNWKNQYHPQHPVNNPANSNWNQPTFTWSPIPLPFWND
jgi:hypothetical protein